MATNPSQPRYGCYVGNIDRSVTLEMLRQMFSQCGTIIDCSLNGRDEDPYRYGFIDFSSEDDRARAMKYNGFTLVGRKLKVGVSKGNVNKPDGYSSGGAHAGPHGGAAGGHRNPHNAGNNMLSNPMGSMMNNSAPLMGQSQQQQLQAQLLLQLIQQGAMDPRNLAPEQQQMLVTVLQQGGGTAPVPAPMPVMPTMPMMPNPYAAAMMQSQMCMVPPAGVPRGGYPMQPQQSGPRGGNQHRPPVNTPPSDETVKLREVQRKQFLDVVRKDAEKYERKVLGKSSKGADRDDKNVSDRESSSASAHGERKVEPEKKRSKMEEEEAVVEDSLVK